MDQLVATDRCQHKCVGRWRDRICQFRGMVLRWLEVKLYIVLGFKYGLEVWVVDRSDRISAGLKIHARTVFPDPNPSYVPACRDSQPKLLTIRKTQALRRTLSAKKEGKGLGQFCVVARIPEQNSQEYHAATLSMSGSSPNQEPRHVPPKLTLNSTRVSPHAEVTRQGRPTCGQFPLMSDLRRPARPDSVDYQVSAESTCLWFSNEVSNKSMHHWVTAQVHQSACASIVAVCANYFSRIATVYGVQGSTYELGVFDNG